MRSTFALLHHVSGIAFITCIPCRLPCPPNAVITITQHEPLSRFTKSHVTYHISRIAYHSITYHNITDHNIAHHVSCTANRACPNDSFVSVRPLPEATGGGVVVRPSSCETPPSGSRNDSYWTLVPVAGQADSGGHYLPARRLRYRFHQQATTLPARRRAQGNRRRRCGAGLTHASR